MSNVLIMPSKSEFAKSFKDTYARLFSPFTLFVFGACWLLAVLAGKCVSGVANSTQAMQIKPRLAGALVTGVGAVYFLEGIETQALLALGIQV